MAVGLSIKVEGANELSAQMQSLSNNISNFRLPLNKASDLLLETFDRNFDSKGATLGEPWAKRKKSYPWQILQKTGKMRKSFTKKVSKVQSVLSNKSEYFKFHQSNKSRKKLPRRVMMKIDLTRQKKILEIFTKWLNKISPLFK